MLVRLKYHSLIIVKRKNNSLKLKIIIVYKKDNV